MQSPYWCLPTRRVKSNGTAKPPKSADVEYWEAFFEQFGLPVALERQPAEAIDGPLQVVLEPRTDFEFDWVEGYPVIPREDAIAYMRENFAHFQPALSMLDDMYDDLDLVSTQQ